MDHPARLWDAQTGQLLGAPLQHRSRVKSAQFSPDGQRVVTASDDHTARVWDGWSGQPLGEPLPHQGGVCSAQFSPDGQRVATASDDAMARIWEAPSAPLPVPDWFSTWLEALGNQRLDDHGRLEMTPPSAWDELGKKMGGWAETNLYTQCARRFLAADEYRTVPPFSSATLRDRVDGLIRQGTAEALHQAVMLDPTNGLALALYAAATLGKATGEAGPALAEAEFLSQRAAALAPSNPEVWAARARILSQTTNTMLALETVEKALGMKTSDAALWLAKGRLLEAVARRGEAAAAYEQAAHWLQMNPQADPVLRVGLSLAWWGTVKQKEAVQQLLQAKRAAGWKNIEEIKAARLAAWTPKEIGLLEAVYQATQAAAQ
jgi:hypothetical protein